MRLSVDSRNLVCYTVDNCRSLEKDALSLAGFTAGLGKKGVCGMKEKYTKPVLELTRFEAHDVIAASSAGNMTKAVNEQIDKINLDEKIFKDSIN